MNTIMWIATGVCIFLLVAGFILGFIRNWCRSLIRLSIVLISLIASFFLAPTLVSLVMNKLVNENTLSVFSFDLDFNEITQDLISGNLGEDISLVSEDIAIIAKAILNVVLNVALFLILFISLVLISLIIYWIVLLIVKIVHISGRAKERKRNNKADASTVETTTATTKEVVPVAEKSTPVAKTKIKKTKTKDIEPEKQSSIGLRFVGAFEGFVTALIICFAIMIPIFGVMNICNEFLDEKTNKSVQVASAYTPSSNLVCGQLYYTDNETIGQVEGLIETYAELKGVYDKSPVGVMFKYTGLKFVGSKMFDYLTKVKIKDEKINFSDEFVTIIKTYNLFKENFIENKFDVSNNNSLDGVNNLVLTVSESKIAKNLVEKIVPVASERFANGEKFFNVSLNVDEQYKLIVEDFIEIFKSAKSISRISFNVRTMVDTLKVINTHNLLENVEQKGLFETLDSDKTIIKEIIVKLAVTEEIKNNLPKILNNFVELIYNEVVGEKDFNISETTEFNVENWEVEANTIQGIISGLLETYTSVLKDGNASQEAIINELENIGKTIDIARTSVILSDSIKEFMIGLLNSDNINFGDKDVDIKNSLTTYINEKWNIVENPTFKFEENFKVLGDTAKITLDMSAGKDVTIQDMSSVIENILKDENVRNETLELLQNDELIQGIVGTDDNAVVVKDIVTTFIENSEIETLEQDLQAGQAVIDLITLNQNSNFNEEKAKEMVETIVSSNAVIKVIETVVENESSSLKNLINENGGGRIPTFNKVIAESETLTAEQRELLNKLFN